VPVQQLWCPFQPQAPQRGGAENQCQGSEGEHLALDKMQAYGCRNYADANRQAQPSGANDLGTKDAEPRQQPADRQPSECAYIVLYRSKGR